MTGDMPYEHKLASLARQGDTFALATLVAHIRGRVFAVAFSSVKHYEDAQDITALVIFHVCRGIRGIRKETSFSSWINSIMRNELHNYRLGESKRKQQLHLERTLTVSIPCPNIFPLLLERVDIERCLAQLPFTYSTVLQLFYWDGLSICEIAQHTGRPEGTVKSWLHFGRQHVAKYMKENGDKIMSEHEQPNTTLTPASRGRKKESATRTTTSMTIAFLHSGTTPQTRNAVRTAFVSTGATLREVNVGTAIQGTSADSSWLSDAIMGCDAAVLDDPLDGRPALEYALLLRSLDRRIRVAVVVTELSRLNPMTVNAYYAAGVKRLLDRQSMGADDVAPLVPESGNLSWSNLSRHAQRALFAAQEVATRSGSDTISTGDLLLGMVSDPEVESGTVHVLVEQLSVKLERVREVLHQSTTSVVRTEVGRVPLRVEPGLKNALEAAHAEATAVGSSQIKTEHLLIGLFADPDGLGAKTLRNVGVEPEHLRTAVLRLSPSKS